MSLAIDPFVMPNELPAEFAARDVAHDGRTTPEAAGASFPDLLDRELDPEARAALEALRSALSSARPAAESGDAAAQPPDGSRSDGAIADGTRRGDAEAGRSSDTEASASLSASRDALTGLTQGGRLATAAPAAVEPGAVTRQAAPLPGDAALTDAKRPGPADAGARDALRNEATAVSAADPRPGAAGTAPPEAAASALRTSDATPVPAGPPVANAAIPSTEFNGTHAPAAATNESAATTATALRASLAVRAARSTSSGVEVEAEAAPIDSPSTPRVANAAAVSAVPRAANGMPAPTAPNAERGTVASDGVPPDGRVAERAPEPDSHHGNGSVGVPASGVTRPDAREAVVRAEAVESASAAPDRTPAAPLPAAPASAEAAMSAPRELPAGPATLEDLPGRIEWLAQRGGGAARVELDPPQLGRVDLIVRVRGNDVEVVIAAHEPAAQAAVQAQRAQLAEGLAARDLRLGQLDVTQAGGDAPEGDSGSGGRTGDPHGGGRTAEGSDGRGRAGLASPPAGVQAARFGVAVPRSDAPAERSRIDLHA